MPKSPKHLFLKWETNAKSVWYSRNQNHTPVTHLAMCRKVPFKNCTSFFQKTFLFVWQTETKRDWGQEGGRGRGRQADASLRGETDVGSQDHALSWNQEPLNQDA